MDERKFEKSTNKRWKCLFVGGVTLASPFFAGSLPAQTLNGPAQPTATSHDDLTSSLFRLPAVENGIIESTGTSSPHEAPPSVVASDAKPKVTPVEEMTALSDFPFADEARKVLPPFAPPVEGNREPLSESGAASPRASFPVVSSAISQRADQQIEQGVSLADRGALFAGRAKVIQALRIIARAMDAETQTDQFTEALTDGFNALEEAKDFSTSEMKPTSRPNLEYIIRSHRSPVFQHASAKSTIHALQAYHAYAADKLSVACGKNRTSSKAMFTLAKIDMLIAGDQDSELSGPRTMTFFQVALSADPKNSSAANELGVRFAKFGQYQDAKNALSHCVELEPTNVIAWQNLAKVHQFLGETELADAAIHEMNLAKSLKKDRPSSQQLSIQWVSPQEFSRGNPQRNLQPTEKPSLARRMFNSLGNGKKARNRK